MIKLHEYMEAAVLVGLAENPSSPGIFRKDAPGDLSPTAVNFGML